MYLMNIQGNEEKEQAERTGRNIETKMTGRNQRESVIKRLEIEHRKGPVSNFLMIVT